MCLVLVQYVPCVHIRNGLIGLAQVRFAIAWPSNKSTLSTVLLLLFFISLTEISCGILGNHPRRSSSYADMSMIADLFKFLLYI